MMHALSLSVSILAGLALTAFAEQSGFALPPRATTTGGKTEIRFAVSAPTDVEVAVLNAEDAVVRHLAAGMLGGGNPPPPPLVAGLAQTVAWDGKDDSGRSVTAAKVRVRLGMKAGSLLVSEAPNLKPAGGKAEGAKPKAGRKRTADNAEAPAAEDANDGDAQTPRQGFNKVGGGVLPTLNFRIMQKMVFADPIYTDGFAASLMLCGDPDTGRCYVRHGSYWTGWHTMDLTTKTLAPLKPFESLVCDLQFGPDGCIYTFHWGQIRKWDEEWKPVEFAALKSPILPLPPRFPSYIAGQYDRETAAFGDELGPISRCVGLDGKIYQILDLPEGKALRLRIWKPDGTLEKEGVLPFGPVRHASNLRVDAAGRLYLVVNGLPVTYQSSAKEKAMNPLFAPFRGTLLRIVPGNWMDKPGPIRGGLTLRCESTEKWMPERRQPGKLFSALWTTMTTSPLEVNLPTPDLAIPGVSWVSPVPECACGCLYFDLDRYGRIYLPDPALRRVRVFDASGNELLDVSEKSGETAVLWPLRLFAFESGFVFWDGVAETLNRQNLDWDAGEVCPLR
jgi:hypothetical protein